MGALAASGAARAGTHNAPSMLWHDSVTPEQVRPALPLTVLLVLPRTPVTGDVWSTFVLSFNPPPGALGGSSLQQAHRWRAPFQQEDDAIRFEVETATSCRRLEEG